MDPLWLLDSSHHVLQFEVGIPRIRGQRRIASSKGGLIPAPNKTLKELKDLKTEIFTWQMTLSRAQPLWSRVTSWRMAVKKPWGLKNPVTQNTWGGKHRLNNWQNLLLLEQKNIFFLFICTKPWDIQYRQMWKIRLGYVIVKGIASWELVVSLAYIYHLQYAVPPAYCFCITILLTF